MKQSIHEKEKIAFYLTNVEINFIKYCREKRHVEGKLIVMKGEPIKFFEPLKSVRFDLTNGK